MSPVVLLGYSFCHYTIEKGWTVLRASQIRKSRVSLPSHVRLFVWRVALVYQPQSMYQPTYIYPPITRISQQRLIIRTQELIFISQRRTITLPIIFLAPST